MTERDRKEEIVYKILKEEYQRKSFKLYSVLINYPDEEGSITEQVVVRAKHAAEAVRAATEFRLPPLSLMNEDWEFPYQEYGVIEVKKYKMVLEYTEEDISSIVGTVLSLHYAERYVNGTKISDTGNELDVIKKIEAMYKLELSKLKQKYARQDSKRKAK